MSLGVYIQVPFCQTKCTYCNFHTSVVSPARFAPYASAVQTEIHEFQTRLASRGVTLPGSFASLPVDTVYFGGGTPSLLRPAQLAGMLNAIRRVFQADFSEVTLEADPETVDAEKIEASFKNGVLKVTLPKKPEAQKPTKKIEVKGV